MPKARKSSKYQKKIVDGKENSKYVDLLDEDKAISGQKFACLSFLSPEKIVKQKELFIFEEFLKKWDFLKSLEKFQQFLSFVAFKHKMDLNVLNADLEDFAKEEKNNLLKTTIEDEYKNFLDANEEHLDSLFNSKYNFQTNSRGIKIRGSFPTSLDGIALSYGTNDAIEEFGVTLAYQYFETDTTT